jgi:hypothetical protein
MRIGIPPKKERNNYSFPVGNNTLFDTHTKVSIEKTISLATD